MTSRLFKSCLIGTGLMILWAPSLWAHPLSFGLLDLQEVSNGKVEVFFKYSGSEDAPMGAYPILPAHCVQEDLRQEGYWAAGTSIRWTARCPEGGLSGREIAVGGLEDPELQVLLRVSRTDGSLFETMLSGANPATTVPDPRGVAPVSGGVFTRYVGLGVEHILKGIDHLLFVLALLLLVRERRKLLWTITAFTLGHSATLSLASLGLLTLAPAPVEVVIALSIVFLSRELLRPPEAPPTLARRHPELIAAGFGFFHGLGFAGVLLEVGLPAGAIPLALLGFNAGVEVGQVLFIAALWVAARMAVRWKLPRPARLAPYAIGIAASFWCMGRMAGLFG